MNDSWKVQSDATPGQAADPLPQVLSRLKLTERYIAALPSKDVVQAEELLLSCPVNCVWDILRHEDGTATQMTPAEECNRGMP